MVAAVVEAELTSDQAQRLADLMRERKASRPAGVVTAALLYEHGRGTLIACWQDRETLERYLAETEVPRGVELMREVGAEPSLRVVDLLELG